MFAAISASGGGGTLFSFILLRTGIASAGFSHFLGDRVGPALPRPRLSLARLPSHPDQSHLGQIKAPSPVQTPGRPLQLT